MARDLYIILGVPSTATLREIKSAYRRRALQLHPDRSGSSSGPFLEIQEAYSVLSDPARRAAYDRQMRALESRARRGVEAETFGGGFRSPFEEISLADSFAEFHPSFEELFERLWRNFSHVPRPKGERAESLTIQVPLTVEQARRGGQIRVLIPSEYECPSCGGGGAVGPYECWRCAGAGRITGNHPVEVSYPRGVRNNCFLRVSLNELGIDNFYLTVWFRVTGNA